jgi:hypothetical protein
VTKYRRRPRENNESFIIAELSTSINNVYTADVANFQRWRTFCRIRGGRLLVQASCHIAGFAAQLHTFRPAKRAHLGLTHRSSKMEIEKEALTVRSSSCVVVAAYHITHMLLKATPHPSFLFLPFLPSFFISSFSLLLFAATQRCGGRPHGVCEAGHISYLRLLSR